MALPFSLWCIILVYISIGVMLVWVGTGVQYCCGVVLLGDYCNCIHVGGNMRVACWRASHISFGDALYIFGILPGVILQQ